jgi:hypothetical protein
MMRWRLVTIVTVLAILNLSVPRTAWAGGGERGTAQEELAYAQREAEAPALRDFTGGWHGVVIILILAAAAVVIIVLVLQHQEKKKATVAEPPPPPPPQTPPGGLIASSRGPDLVPVGG